MYGYISYPLREVKLSIDNKNYPPHIPRMQTGLDKAIQVAGGIRALGRMLGITHGAIRQWEGEIPAKHLIRIEELTGVPREELRPDLYRREKAG